MFSFGQANHALELRRYPRIPFGHLKALCSLVEDTGRQPWESVYIFVKHEVVLHQWRHGIHLIYNLLIASETAVDSRVDDSVETHGQGVDVLHLPGLTLRDQRPQLQVLVLDYLDSIFQRTHLHLGPKNPVKFTNKPKTMVEKSFHSIFGEP